MGSGNWTIIKRLLPPSSLLSSITASDVLHDPAKKSNTHAAYLPRCNIQSNARALRDLLDYRRLWRPLENVKYFTAT